MKGKLLPSLADAVAFARERRTKRKDERTLTPMASHVSPIVDLSNKAIEFAFSSAITYAIDDVYEASVPIVAVESNPIPPPFNPSLSPTHSPPQT